jgi:hypothetical protein
MPGSERRRRLPQAQCCRALSSPASTNPQVTSVTASFDATLSELAAEKLRLEAEALAAWARLLAGRQELAILQECQVGRSARLAILQEWQVSQLLTGVLPDGVLLDMQASQLLTRRHISPASSTALRPQPAPAHPSPLLLLPYCCPPLQVREEQLLAKRSSKLADLREVRDRAAAVQRQLDARAADAEAVAQRRQEVVAELDTLVAPDNPFREALSKIFFRWVARAGGGERVAASQQLRLRRPNSAALLRLASRAAPAAQHSAPGGLSQLCGAQEDQARAQAGPRRRRR